MHLWILMRLSNSLMQLHVSYKSQNILSIAVEISFISSSSYFPHFLAMFPTNNISTDTPQVYRDPGLFLWVVQDNCVERRLSIWLSMKWNKKEINFLIDNLSLIMSLQHQITAYEHSYWHFSSTSQIWQTKDIIC